MTSDLLKLNGKDLEEAIEKIAKENPSKYRYWTEKEMEIVRKLRAKGMSSKVIAESIGRSVPSVNYLLTNSPYY